jgi:1,4-dihydroxy-6-naphthoate synthase
MFYGFASGAVTIPGCDVKPFMQDIESLNQRALRGEFEITAVSAHAYAYCSERYAVLSCGASVGRGYGPILIGKILQAGSRVALPGIRTTAALAFELWRSEWPEVPLERVQLPFDQILPAVIRGDVDAGLIIHEGQLTYQDHGLEKCWDAGRWWQEKTGCPLPLGLAVVRRDLGAALARQIDAAFRQSILYAQAHPAEAEAYALQYGRGLSPSLGKRFIGLYVNADTLEQGSDVRDGLQQLYSRAHAAGLLPVQPSISFVA